MRKGIVWVLAGVMFAGGLAWTTGCKEQGNKAAGIPVAPKWKGEPYRIAVDTPKPGTKAALVPGIKFTANPAALEKRATLIVRFDESVVKSNQTVINQIILSPFDLAGAEGTLPADSVASANTGLASLLSSYKVKGKVKLQVALARSSLSRGAGDAELNEKRLSDWLPIESEFKGAH
jgi:hypothetical protein